MSKLEIIVNMLWANGVAKKRLEELANAIISIVNYGVEKPAAGPWRTDEPPKDKPILIWSWAGVYVIEWVDHLDGWRIYGTSQEFYTKIIKWAEILEEE